MPIRPNLAGPGYGIGAFRGILATALVLALGATQAACGPGSGPGAGSPSAPTTTSAGAGSVPAATPSHATAGWTPYRDSVDHFSLRYPPAWQQRTCPNDGHTGLFLAPSSAALGLCNSGYGGQMSIVALTGDQRSAFQLAGAPDLVTSPVTVSGVAGTRQSETALASDLGPVAGTKLVVYVFYTSGRTYRCSYSQAPTGAISTDVLADFDLMITDTLSFSA